MNNRGDFNIGDEIRNIVQDAVKYKDFSRLNRDIGNAVNGAMDDVRKSFDRNRERNQSWNSNHNHREYEDNSKTWKTQDTDQKSYNHSNNNRSDNNRSDNNRSNHNHNYNDHNNRNNNTYNYYQGYEQNKPVPKPVKLTVPVGQVSGTLFTVFGTIGSVSSVIAAIVLAVVGNLFGISSINNIITFGILPCFITSMALSLNGGRIRNRLKRFQRYISQMHGRNYCLMKDLSSVTGRSNKYTVKDLQKMILIGMFPEGHIDDKKTCFMLNNESYEQYLKLQDNMRRKDIEEQAKNNANKMQEDQKQEDRNNKKDSLDPAIRQAIEEGRQYVHKIRNANIAIPGEEISCKLDRLEDVTGKIFDYVEVHPEKLPEIKKFTEYFLPTTLKLLDAYREFDDQPVEGENISAAKKEIEKTLDTINLAFENLLDGLFEDAAMDISTDISVMETMFAQEGLTEKNVSTKIK